MSPHDEQRSHLRQILGLEMPANLVVSFDFGKFSAITQAAIGVPLGQE